MITINSKKINTLNQNSYNKFITALNINQLFCPCGHCGTLSKHAYYTRSIKVSGGIKLTISILRVKCSHCGKTHAVFPLLIVPYSQISITDHISIISNNLNKTSQKNIMYDNPLIDENSIKYILHNYYKYWSQRLKTYSISIKSNICSLIKLCFKHYNRQFMQIKCTKNILLSSTHIT
ncbi:MAG: DUF6431 domain-containing protein [Methanobrevibacter sp.]|jgi:type III secretory pathway component EscV|nr:DUF6431 domain-containing protein [Methanobrevibacter sp.]